MTKAVQFISFVISLVVSFFKVDALRLPVTPSVIFPMPRCAYQVPVPGGRHLWRNCSKDDYDAWEASIVAEEDALTEQLQAEADASFDAYIEAQRQADFERTSVWNLLTRTDSEFSPEPTKWVIDRSGYTISCHLEDCWGERLGRVYQLCQRGKLILEDTDFDKSLKQALIKRGVLAA